MLVCLCAFVGCLTCLFPTTVLAGAWEDAQSMAGGYIPNVPEPPTPTIDRSDRENRDSTSDWERAQAREARAQARAEARAARAQRRAEERKRREEARRLRESKKRSQHAQRSFDQMMHRNNQNTSNQSNNVSASNWPQGLPPKRPLTASPLPSTSSRKVDRRIIPGKEAEKLAEVKLAIAVLKKKSNLTDAERQELEELETFARHLWKILATKKGLSPAIRAKYVLNLPVSNFGTNAAPKVTKASIQTWQKKTPPEENVFVPFSQTMTDVVVAGVEQLGGEIAEHGIPELPNAEVVGTPRTHYENLLGIGKIAWKLKIDKDVPGAVSETVDFVIGKIPYPQAGFAVQGGRMAASMNFHAFDAFAKSAMSAVGNTDFDIKAFWKEFEKEMNPAQKAIFQWIGGHDDAQ